MILIEGWIKLHRSLLGHWVLTDAEALSIWIHILLKAAYEPKREYQLGKLIDLLPGQLIFRGPQLKDHLRIDINKIYRTLKVFEDEGMIAMKHNGKRYSVITVNNWDVYQGGDMPSESKRETKEKPESIIPCGSIVDVPVESENQIINKRKTIYKNEKNSKKEKKDICPAAFEEIISYLNEKANTSYRANSRSSQQHISARLNEGFTIEDFKRVIDNKVSEWGHEPTKGEKDMRNYLRPETLFGSKFESYLNSKAIRRTVAKRDNFMTRDYDDSFYDMLNNSFDRKARDGSG